MFEIFYENYHNIVFNSISFPNVMFENFFSKGIDFRKLSIELKIIISKLYIMFIVNTDQ